MQNLFTKRDILIARQFCYIYIFEKSKGNFSDNTRTKKSCKTFTNEQKKYVKHSHKKNMEIHTHTGTI